MVELQNETLKRENERLTRENAEQKLIISDLKQTLHEALQYPMQTPEHVLSLRRALSEPTGDCITDLEATMRQKDEQLNRTIQQLNESRRQLSDTQERLTVSEQVTIATQRRVLQQEGICEKLLTENIYENLRPELIEEHYDSQVLPVPASQTASLCQRGYVSNVFHFYATAFW